MATFRNVRGAQSHGAGSGQPQPPGVWNPAAQPTTRQEMPESGAGGGGGGVFAGRMDLPPGADHVMNLAAGSIQQNMNTRLQSAVPIVGNYWLTLKSYFEVDNQYVLAKLKCILFPVLLKKKKWRREVAEGALDAHPGAEGQPSTAGPMAGLEKKYLSPVRDENAPDLYLPLMAFVTYILICSYAKGTNGKFTPEVLSEVMQSCLLTQFLEVLVLKSGLTLLGGNSATAPLLDLTANTGYKYVGLCLNMVLGLACGRSVYLTACFLWTGPMAAYFMLKTLSNNYARTDKGLGGDGSGKALRMPLLMAFAALQLLSIWWLGYGGEIAAHSAGAYHSAPTYEHAAAMGHPAGIGHPGGMAGGASMRGGALSSPEEAHL